MATTRIDQIKKTSTISRSENDMDVAALVSCALWLAFTGNLLRGVFNGNSAVRQLIARPAIDAGGVLLIFIGIAAYFDARTARMEPFIRFLTGIVLACTAFALFRALPEGPDILRWCQMGVLGYGCAFAVFAGAHTSVYQRCLKTIYLQAAIAVIFVGYVLLYWTPQSRAEWWLTAANTEALGPICSRALFGIPFLLASHRQLRPLQLVLVAVGYLEYVTLNILGDNRSAVLIAFVIVPLVLVLTGIRQRTPFLHVGRAAVLLLVVAGTTACGLLLAPSFAHRLQTHLRVVLDRYAVENADSPSVGDLAGGATETVTNTLLGTGSRSLELRDLLSQTSVEQMITGRGFGVPWKSRTWAVLSQQWYVVHVGPGYMLLVGGIGMAVVFTLLLFSAPLYAWSKLSLTPAAAGAFMYLSIGLVNYFQHGFLYDEVDHYFLWLCIGFAAIPATSITQRRNIGIIHKNASLLPRA